MAKRPSQPNGYLSNVWDIAGDSYDHNDIKGWLDTIDRLMGQLYSDRILVGAVMAISGPSLSGTPDTNPIVVPVGWALCDGRTVTAANHDFPAPYSGNTIFLPDYRGRALVGADSAQAVRSAGSITVAPGVKGRQGATTSVVPDHYHIHDHTHAYGGNDAIETTPFVSGLNDSVNTDASGSGYTLTRTSHVHGLKRYNTSQAEIPITPDGPITMSVFGGGVVLTLNEGGPLLQTTTQLLKSAGADDQPTGGAAGDDLTLDVRPPGEGVYWIMKIKKYAGSATP